MPLAIIGGIAAIGSTVAGVLGNNAANRTARNNNAANNALSQQQYETNRGLEQPYIDQGNQAGDALQGFLGLGGDPAKTQAAFNNYLNSTGYQFTKQQGIDAADQSASSKGLLNSGGALKALDEYGSGIAQQYGQQYASNLNTVANRGANSANALAGFGNTNVSNQTGNNNTAAGVQENAFRANGTAFGGLIDKLGGMATGAIGNRGASSFGGGSNAFNQPGYAPFAASGG